MKEFLDNLFASNFMPHGQCYLWDRGLIWLHVVSDSLIALAYFSIPVTLIYFIRKRRDLPFNWIFVWFGIFILACGGTHTMEVWTLWHADYWVSGTIKAVTALASVATAILLVQSVPRALTLPSPSVLRLEIAERKRTEQALHETNNQLELKVLERTAELKKANEDLVAEIAQHKQADEALRKAQNQLRQIIDAIPQQVSVFSADWTPLFANQGELAYTGLSPQEVRSKDAVAKIFHPEDFKKLEALRERGDSEGTPFELEARIRGKDGQYRWFLIRDNPLLDEQGRVLRWYGTRTDIEDRKRAEEAYSKAQAELAHITRVMTMGELAASIAHEVNQPLSGVVINGNTCLRWLAANPPNLDEAREAASRIVRDGKRAGDVVAHIRALATKSSSNKERMNINEAIQDVLELTGDEIREKDVRLKMELADELPPVMGDRVQLQQVLLNLVINGVDAMSAVEGRDRELVIKAESDEAGQVRVEVRDSGVGLDDESIQNIFNPFYSTKPAGMGMGLSISRSIIENHGGRIWATPNDGPGATFHFTVPKWQ